MTPLIRRIPPQVLVFGLYIALIAFALVAVLNPQ